MIPDPLPPNHPLRRRSDTLPLPDMGQHGRAWEADRPLETSRNLLPRRRTSDPLMLKEGRWYSVQLEVENGRTVRRWVTDLTPTWWERNRLRVIFALSFVPFLLWCWWVL